MGSLPGLKYGAKVDLGSKSGTTALMFAAQAGTIRSVYLLLKAGANPNLRPDDGKTVYDIALSSPGFKTNQKIAELVRWYMK